MALGSLVAILIALRRDRNQFTFAVTVGSLALFVLAAGGPLLLGLWTRGDSERALWVIRQGYPCSAMGGGPGSLWVLGTSWISAIAALAYAATSPDPPRRVALPFFAHVIGCLD